jgi:hypothetical protein
LLRHRDAPLQVEAERRLTAGDQRNGKASERDHEDRDEREEQLSTHGERDDVF